MAVLASAMPATAHAAEAAPPESKTKRVLSKVHTDAVSVFAEGDGLVLGTKADVDGALGKRLDPASVIFNVEEEARLQVPDSAQYAFLGAAGSDVWIAPETNPGGALLWPGFNTEAVPSGVLDGNQVRFNLTSVTGPGTVELFQTPIAGPRRLLSSQGEDLRTYTLSTGQHVHANWAFSARGTYVLTMTATGTVGGTAVSSVPVDYTFHVGDIAPAVATSTAVSVSPSSVTSGSPVTLTATVTPSGASGWVEFFDGASSLGYTAVEGGSAALTTSALPLGTRSITARYLPRWTNDHQPSTSEPATVTVNTADTGVLVVDGVKDSYAAGETLRARATGITPTEGQTFRWIIQAVTGGTRYVMGDVEAPGAELVRELTTSYDGWRISVQLRQGTTLVQESAPVPLAITGPNVGSGEPLTLSGLAESYLEGDWAELTATHAPLQEGQSYRWVYRNPRTSAAWIAAGQNGWLPAPSGNNPFSVYVQNFRGLEAALQIVDAQGGVVAQSAVLIPNVEDRELQLSGMQTVYRPGDQITIKADLYPASENITGWEWRVRKADSTLEVIEGATSATLTLPVDMSLNGALIFVSAIENRSGFAVRSVSATITVTDAAPEEPVLFFDAPSGHYHQGNTVQLRLNADPAPVEGDTVRWEWKRADQDEFVVMEGVSGLTHSVRAQQALDGAVVRAQLLAADGTVKATAAPVTISVDDHGAAPSEQLAINGLAQQYQAGDMVTLNAVVTPVSVLDRYEWWVQKAGAAEPTRVEGVTGAQYSFFVDASYDGASVLVKLVKNTGATYVQSASVTLAGADDGPVVDERYFAKLRDAVNGYVADGTTSAKTAGNILERLDRAEGAAQTGSEVRTIALLEQFIARVKNQVKGDAADLAARGALVADAEALIAFYRAIEEDENAAV
jgi:surface-anchored protein